jgi:hypothetical protein
VEHARAPTVFFALMLTDSDERLRVLRRLAFEFAPRASTRESESEPGVLVLDGLGSIWSVPSHVQASAPGVNPPEPGYLPTWPFDPTDASLESFRAAVGHAVAFLRRAAESPSAS